MSAEYRNAAPESVRVQRLLPLGLQVTLADGSIGIIREREIAWDRRQRSNWRRFHVGDLLEAVRLGAGHGQRQLWERVFDLGFTMRSEGGSGLGLSITRSLAESFGGQVAIQQSSILWGTTVVIELPCAL